MDDKKVLRELSEISGVSGAEKEIGDRVKELFNHYVQDVRKDTLGNIIGYKPGSKNGKIKIMLAAHMDEIGLMITDIEEGFLRFTTVGGVDKRTLVGQEVLIEGRDKTYSGIIGAKPSHIQDKKEKKQSYNLDELYIDPGLPAEEVEEKFQIGGFITINRESSALEGERMAGKAFDDRAGLLVILETLEELTKLRHDADVYPVATVQEEVGVRGAFTSTYGIVPEIGIAIDVTHAQIPGLSEEETAKLGEGPVLALGPQIHPSLFAKLKSVAEEFNINYQIQPSPRPGGTDAYAIQITRGGISTALLSIPLRYMHTSVETIDLSDIKTTSRLLARVIADLEADFKEELLCF